MLWFLLVISWMADARTGPSPWRILDDNAAHWIFLISSWYFEVDGNGFV